MWDFMKNIFKGVGTFFKVFIKTTTSQIVEDIGDIAIEVVHTVENKKPDAAGEDKFKEAYEVLTNILFQRGITYTKNALNIAIELAVAVVKENK